MSYSIVKPDPGPSPFLDAPTIQGNFAAWATTFKKDHMDMNLRTQGDHKYVVMTNLVAGPPLVGDEDILFNKNATQATGGPTQPQLFVKIPVFLPTMADPTPSPVPIAMQLTYNQVNVAGPQFQSFLPGGYLLYFGSETNVVGSRIVNLVPVPTKIIIAIATADKAGAGNLAASIATSINSASQFTIFSNVTSPNTVQYWVIAQA